MFAKCLSKLAVFLFFWILSTSSDAAKPPPIPEDIRAFSAQVIAEKQKRSNDEGFDVTIRAEINLENFNDDGLQDFVLVYGDDFHCGTGGCVLEFYRNDGGGSWVKVYDYQGSSFYHLSSAKVNGERDIVYLAFVARENVSAVAQWNGESYELNHYVTAVKTFYPTNVTYWSKGPKKVLDYPFSKSAPLYQHDPRQILMPLATTEDGAWHMLLLSPSTVGFIDDAGLKKDD